MKKRLIAVILGSVIAASLCGCSGQNNNSSSQTASGGESTHSVSDAGGSEKETAGSSGDNGGEKSAAASAAESKGGSSAAVSQDSDGTVYNDEGEVIKTPTKYVSTSQLTVDISDKEMASFKEDMTLAFLTSTKEFEDWYNAGKDKYSLEKTDSGKTFSELTEGFNDVFFQSSNVLVIVQSYDKDAGIEIGDTHNESDGTYIDIYKNKPASDDKAAYVLNISIYNKEEVSQQPQAKVYPAGELYTDESDPDVIVSVGDDEDEEEVENNVSVTEDGDIVYTN